MKIALIGYGKMGKMVEQAALSKNHTIDLIIDSKSTIPKSCELSDCDVVIDFSQPHCVLENIKKASSAGKNIIMGTTGWDDHFQEVKKIVEDSGIGFLYSANFSLGMALFLKMVTSAAKLLKPFEFYDVSGLEIHHNKKLDSPSGTAKMIINNLQAELPAKDAIQFASVRVGSTPGTHSLIFDSPADTITLTHTARNREGFAHGAVLAAEWLQGKKGMFTLDDFFDK